MSADTPVGAIGKMKPLSIVVLTYPCETAELLLTQLRRRGFTVNAVILQKDRNLRRLWRLVRMMGFRRACHLVLDRLEAILLPWRAAPWRRDSLYAACAERVVVVSHLNHPSCRAALDELRPDVAIIGGAGILHPEVFRVPRFGTLNVHPGVLPRYRGCSPICWAVEEGGDTGVTVHVVDSGIDTGPILAQRVIRVRPGETLPLFERRLFAEGFELVTDVLDSLARGLPFAAVEQSREGSRYYRMAPPSVCRRAEQKLAELAKAAADDDR